jgi:hypothetical protein
MVSAPSKYGERGEGVDSATHFLQKLNIGMAAVPKPPTRYRPGDRDFLKEGEKSVTAEDSTCHAMAPVYYGKNRHGKVSDRP